MFYLKSNNKFLLTIKHIAKLWLLGFQREIPTHQSTKGRVVKMQSS